MKLIKEDKQKRIINAQEEIPFNSFSGYHLIILSARAKGEKQISDSSTDDEELTIQIDDRIFPKLNLPNSFVDSPAAVNGGRLHNLSKAVYIFILLKGKNHKIILKADNPPGTATFESLEIYSVDLADSITLDPKIQAEDGDRREWITFVLDDLPLQEVNITVTYSRRKRDSDDIKVKIDGQTQGNILSNIKNFLWYFVGLLIPKISPTKTESQTFITNLSSGLHYIELNADRMPILEKITLNFGSKLSVPKRILTVNDPEWTGDFLDDSDEILLARLIIGEAENQPKEAKTGVGFTVINRLKKQNPNWGYSIREIILKGKQYDGMWNKNTYEKVRNPFNDTSEKRKKEWQESYEVAVGILSGKLPDPAAGATNFHSYTNLETFPDWATKENYKTKLGDIYFYELEK